MCFKSFQTLASGLIFWQIVPSFCSVSTRSPLLWPRHANWAFPVLCSPLKNFPGLSWLQSSPPFWTAGVFPPSSGKQPLPSLCALLRSLLLAVMFSLILSGDWLPGLPGITLQGWVSDSRQDSAMLTTQNFYSHPDSPRDELFGTPTQGWAGPGWVHGALCQGWILKEHLGLSLS